MDIDAALKILEKQKDYRVLKRLGEPTVFPSLASEPIVGIALDVETTGLDIEISKVIELGMIKFVFDREGNISKVVDKYHSFNDPNEDISQEITNLTGIRTSDVKGKKISAEDVERFVNDASLIIAHNAAFDRPFCENISSKFFNISWACSASEISWKTEGIAGSKLEYIVYSFGKFFDAHRALDDCNALLNILCYNLPISKELVFSALLKEARRTETRICAEGAPYEARLVLKKMGYRWNDGQNGYPRAWWKDVAPDIVDQEIALLAKMDNTIAPITFEMTAKNRYSRRRK